MVKGSLKGVAEGKSRRHKTMVAFIVLVFPNLFFSKSVPSQSLYCLQKCCLAWLVTLLSSSALELEVSTRVRVIYSKEKAYWMRKVA